MEKDNLFKGFDDIEKMLGNIYEKTASVKILSDLLSNIIKQSYIAYIEVLDEQGKSYDCGFLMNVISSTVIMASIDILSLTANVFESIKELDEDILNSDLTSESAHTYLKTLISTPPEKLTNMVMNDLKGKFTEEEKKKYFK